MEYKFGKNLLLQQKALAANIRGLADRFDPNAVDGDNDGRVQDGTRFERPATPSAPKPKPIVGRISPVNISYGSNSLPNTNKVKNFDGYDADYIKEQIDKIINTAKSKYGEIETVDDAIKALKTVFNKVDINHFGANWNTSTGRSLREDTLSELEKSVIYALLYALNDTPHLKNRRLTLGHELDSEGLPAPGGSNGLRPRLRLDGQPDYPEFGVIVSIPFHEDSLREYYFADDSDASGFLDGVALQTGAAILRAARDEKDPSKKAELENTAIKIMSMAVAMHEAVHAIDQPNKADFLIDGFQTLNPQAQNDKDRLKAFSDAVYPGFSLMNVYLMRNMLKEIMSQNSVGFTIRRAMAYEALGPDVFLSKMKETRQRMSDIRDELVDQLNEINRVIRNSQNDPIRSLGAGLALNSVQSELARIRNEIASIDTEINELETNIKNGTPEQTEIGRMHKAVYDNGLNYLFDVFPPGHPGHNADVVMTVDENGQSIPYLDPDGLPIKNEFASPNYMQSSILSLMDAKDFIDEMNKQGISINGIAQSILNPSDLINTDDNGNRQIDFSSIFTLAGPDARERAEIQARISLFSAMLSAVWPPQITDEQKWELVQWMGKISRYGSLPHHRYLNGLLFASPSLVSSAEIVPELISSLMLGGGAARTPMNGNVKSAIISMLNWVYGKDNWQSLMPPISLEALGIK